MNSLERFYATAERRPVDRPAAWLGMPDPQALPGLFSYYGVKDIDVYKRQRLSLTNFKGKIKSAYWMDPVTGMQTFICEVTGKEEAVFLPPEREDGSDSVLVIR